MIDDYNEHTELAEAAEAAILHAIKDDLLGAALKHVSDDTLWELDNAIDEETLRVQIRKSLSQAKIEPVFDSGRTKDVEKFAVLWSKP